MAHIATKRFNYATQFAILLLLTGVGFIVGGALSLLPFIGKIDFSKLSGGGENLMDALLKPENANALRFMQFISTLFAFFMPAFFYAKVCHKKALMHLGFIKMPSLKQLVLVLAIMFFALFFIANSLSEIWNHIPFPQNWQLKFKAAEDAYNKQILVMARMNGAGDFILSLFIVAFLPAIFEEVIFRGALQNLLSRWLKAPIWAIVIASIIFSAVHGSYDGFVIRFVLGFILGWLFYRTGNIWVNIAAHFINNAIGVISLYFYSTPGKPVEMPKIEEHFPIWLGLVGLVAIIMLLKAFDKVSKNDIDRPGQEVLLPGYINPNDPFTEEVDVIGNQNQA